MQHPLISVIVPAYNSEKYLEEALNSIFRQEYEPIEIIVVDDGSTDKTADVTACFGEKIRYVYQENGGPGIARNTGLKIAQGEIIAFLDADDFWPENNLNTQLEYLLKDHELEIVMGQIQRLGLEKTEQGAIFFKEIDEPSFNISLAAGLYKKSIFEKIGHFEPLFYGEDLDWFMRVKENKIKMTNLETVTLYYRLHESNLTRNQQQTKSGVIKALKNSIIRRRGQGK